MSAVVLVLPMPERIHQSKSTRKNSQTPHRVSRMPDRPFPTPDVEPSRSQLPLRVQRELAERFGHRFDRIAILSNSPPPEAIHQQLLPTPNPQPGPGKVPEGAREQPAEPSGITTTARELAKANLPTPNPQPGPAPQEPTPEQLAATEASFQQALDTLVGAIQGEFNPEPTVDEIGVDLLLSLIPGLDQVADARDLVAHLYYMIAQREYISTGRWVGLGFTLIGIVPVFGSLLKSASKLGPEEGIPLLTKLSQQLGLGGALESLQGGIRQHWDSWTTLGGSQWEALLNRMDRWMRVVNVISPILTIGYPQGSL